MQKGDNSKGPTVMRSVVNRLQTGNLGRPFGYGAVLSRQQSGAARLPVVFCHARDFAELLPFERVADMSLARCFEVGSTPGGFESALQGRSPRFIP